MKNKPDSPLNTSLEDLLKLAEIDTSKQKDTPSIPIPPELDPVYSFLLNFKIEQGKNKVSDAILFELFSKWKSSHGVSKISFNLQMSKYLEFTTSKERKYYLINTKGVRLKEESLKYLLNKSSHKKTRSKTLKKHFEHFMTRYSIEEGTDKVPNSWIEGHILYFFYNRWHFERTKGLEIGQNTFFSLCRLYLPTRVVKKKNTEIVYFKVNNKFIDNVSQQSIDNLREGWKKKTHGNKKRQSKIPEPETGIEP